MRRSPRRHGASRPVTVAAVARRGSSRPFLGLLTQLLALVAAGSAAAQTVTLSADPAAMPAGGTSTLTWVTADVVTCVASEGWSGPLAPAGGSQSDAPIATTQYTITCDGPGGQAIDSATITVGPAVTATLGADVASLPLGGSSLLSWSSTDATACVGTGFDTADAPSGSVSVSPTATTLYSLTCTGVGGATSAPAQQTVSVGPAVTATLGADVASIPLGGSSLLSWSSTDATSCVGTGFDTANAPSGSVSVSPTATTLYSLTCTGVGGATSAPAQQTVSVGPAVTATLGADVASIPLGGSSLLSWSSTDATSCVGTGFDTGNAASGSVLVSPTTTTLYSVTCSGAGGAMSAPAQQTVSVGPAVTAGLGADVDTIPLGGSSLLTWSSTDATACVGTGFDTANAPSGSVSVSPTATTLYSLTCTGVGGATSAPAQQTVSVGPAVTATLGADVASIPLGGSSLLSWSSTDATACVGTGFDTADAPSGSVLVSPTATTLYSVTCSGAGGAMSAPAQQTVSVGPAITATLGADVLMLPLGGTSQLSWSSENATSCTGTNFETADATAGVLDVSPAATTVYSLTCSGAGGATSSVADVTVTVIAAVAATLTTNPSAVPIGGSADLSWGSTSATSCVGSGFSTSGAPSGSIQVAPTVTTDYSVTCTGNGGTTSPPANATLTIGPAVAVTLSANPTTIALGGASNLTWSSTDATSCTGTGFDTGGAANGTTAVSPSVSTIYSVICTGAGGATSPAANASVAVGGGVTAFLTADFSSIPLGGSGVLTWSSSNATSCTGTGFATGGAVAGSASVTPTTTTLYSVLCTGAGGANDSADFTITVDQAVTASLTATPETIALNGSSSLAWSGANATSCTGFGFSTGGAVSGQVDVSPTTSTVYGVTCRGNGGATSPGAQALVTVGGSVTATLTATPPAIALGGTSTLQWNGTNATSCVGTGFDTGGAASGSAPVSPTANTAYSVTCSGAGGATSNPASVTVTVGAAVSATLVATPDAIAQGGSSTLSWSGDNATSCTGVGFETGNAPSGSVAVSPAATTAYSVTCTGAGGATSPAAEATVTVGPAVTALLSAAPTAIAAGGSSLLTWGSDNATSCTASSAQDPAWNGARAVEGGSLTVSPTVDATYTLTCGGAGGATSTPASVTISVGPAVTASLSATPTAIAFGGTSQLTWGSANATSCTASSADDPSWNGSRAVAGGSLDVTPTATSTYTLSCAGAGGATSQPASVTVVVGSAVTVSLTATPSSIAPGGSSDLSWSSGNATSCVGTGFDTGGEANGSVQVSPTTTTSYSVVCTGAGGATSAPATASVTVGSAVAATLTATPTLVALGGSSTLDWGSANATSCAGTGFPTGGATSGSISVSPTETKTYTVTCTGAGGATSPIQSATVTVGPDVTATLAADPDAIALGGTSELSWESSNATSCLASSPQDPTWSGAQAIGGGTVTVSPSVTSTYTLVCTGAGGATSAPASVTISVGQSVTATLSATFTSIALGGASDLTWGSSNATGCVGSSLEDPSWNGARDVAGGTVSVSPTVTSTYQLICVGAGGAVSPTASVTVSVAGSVTAQLGATPGTVGAGGTSNLSWSSANATTCAGTGFSTGGATSGSLAVSPTATTTYSMSCAGDGGAISPPVSTTVTIAPLPTVSLTATPTTIAQGGSSELEWLVSNATSCTGSSVEDASWNGAKPVSGGFLSVSPNETATYRLSCTDAFDQTVEDSVTVVVSSGPIVDLIANPGIIDPLGTSTLSWTVDNAVSCTAFSAQDSAWAGDVPVDGAPVLVTPPTTSTYTLTCTDSVGQVGNDEATVRIRPTVTLTADPTSVSLGGSTALAWATTNATSCEASGAPDWTGSISTGPAAALVTPTDDTVYSITCTGPGGTANDSVAVTVASSPGDPPPTVILNADPLRVGAGDSTTLSWVTKDAESCVASSTPAASDWNGAAPIGTRSRVVRPAADTLYTLTCKNPSGVERSANVAVTVAPPPTLNLTASPLELAGGASTQLTWTPTDAQTCVASGGWTGDKAASGSTESVVVNATSTFTLRCTGLSGDVISEVTVVVVPPPTLTLSANRTLMATGGRARLTWATTDADSCQASGGWSGPRDAGGSSEQVTPLVTTDYTLTCTGVGGVVNRTVQIQVDPDRAVQRLASWGEAIAAFRNDLVVVASYDDGIQVVDLSAPTAPALVEAWDPITCIDETPYGPVVEDFIVEDVEVDGTLAFLSSGPCGVWIVDLDDLVAGPVAVIDTEGWTESVHVDGDYAYVADYNGGVLIFDVADPTAPFEVARVGFDDPAMGAVLDIDVAGDYAYVAAVPGLRVLDVSDPGQAFEVGRFDTNEVLGEIPQDIHVVGSVAYMPVWTTGMLIMDINSPDDPSVLASVGTSYAIYRVRTDGNRAYVAEGVEGVVVLDIADPASPVELERIQLGKLVWGLERIGGRTVISFGDEDEEGGGLQVIVDR